MRLLITGITGSFGHSFLAHVEAHSTWDIIGVARNEGRLEHLAESGTKAALLPRDITDWTQLQELRCDAIVHAAALKRVGSSHENPEEYARVNVGGTANVCRLTRQNGAKLLFISSDKAVMAHNCYGATKRVGEVMALNSGGSVVRGGNVWQSDGSVSQKFAAAVLAGHSAIIHDPKATRFHLPMPYWVSFVFGCLLQMQGHEIFAPKLSAYEMGDLAHSFRKVHGLNIINGIRQANDKRHEYLVSPVEAPLTVDMGSGYVQGGDWEGVSVPEKGISSKTARRMMVTELMDLVRQL